MLLKTALAEKRVLGRQRQVFDRFAINAEIGEDAARFKRAGMLEVLPLDDTAGTVSLTTILLAAPAGPES